MNLSHEKKEVINRQLIFESQRSDSVFEVSSVFCKALYRPSFHKVDPLRFRNTRDG